MAEPAAGTAAGIYEVKEKQSQPVASVRVKCKQADIGATMATIYPEICGHLNAIGSRMTGLPFARYHAFAADEVDVEAGSRSGSRSPRRAASGTASCHKARGPIWAVYWTDPGMVPDPAKWRTQLIAPIE